MAVIIDSNGSLRIYIEMIITSSNTYSYNQCTTLLRNRVRAYYLVKVYCSKQLCVQLLELFFVLDSRRRIPKQVPADDFYLCNASDSGKFIGCGKNVKLRCKVSTTTCIYVVSCPRRNDQFICDIPKHSYSHFVCCTPYC